MDPAMLAAQLRAPEVDISELPNGQGGSFVTGLIHALKSGATLPGDVYNGTVDPMSGEGIARAQDLAGTMMTGGLAGAEPGAVGVFGGRLAKTADLEALKRAEAATASGRWGNDVWYENGWGKGKDGQWRFEIPDQDAKLASNLAEARAGAKVGLEDLGDDALATLTADSVLQHPKLWAAYPDLAETQVVFENGPIGPRGARGTFSRGVDRFDDMITLNGNLPDEQMRSTLLHELQHAVQEREGFAQGTSGADPNYRRSAGEVEARNVQRRADSGDFERRLHPPWVTEDVKAADQVLSRPVGTVEQPVVADSAPIRAYHGSPHDFDRFDLSKIGTGEGAQAYGHGLYFAENEATAKSYRDALAPRANVSAGGGLNQAAIKGIADELGMDRAAGTAGNVWQRMSTSSSVDDYLSKLQSVDVESLRKSFPQIAAEMDNELRLAQELKKRGLEIDRPNPGHMYEVAINADPERFLDWDKPLYRQSDAVRGSLDNLGVNTEPQGKWTVEPTKNGDKWALRNVWGERAGTFKDQATAEAKAAAMTDQHNTGGVPLTYQRLGGNHVYGNLDTGEASRKLLDAGIPGIRYLDQGSRMAGDGSRNFVVFDDSLVDILKKYGVASIAALPPAVQMMLQGSGQAPPEDLHYPAQ